MALLQTCRGGLWGVAVDVGVSGRVVGGGDPFIIVIPLVRT